MMKIRTTVTVVTCIVMVLFVGVVTPSSFEAAPQEAEEQILEPIESGVIYLGPMMDDRAFEQLILGQKASGDILAFNVWTSAKQPKLKSNLTIDGMRYLFCSDEQIYMGHMLGNLGNSIEVTIKYKAKGRSTYTMQTTHRLNGEGFFVVYNVFSGSQLREDLYKLTVNYSVTSGGSGKGKETCYFIMVDC